MTGRIDVTIEISCMKYEMKCRPESVKCADKSNILPTPPPPAAGPASWACASGPFT